MNLGLLKNFYRNDLRGNVIVKQHTYGCGTNSKACSEVKSLNSFRLRYF